MIAAEKFTSADLLLLPEDNKRYEIIEGDLYVSRSPSYEHQYTCNRLGQFLANWNDLEDKGAVMTAPGLILSGDDDAVPDVVWISRERLMNSIDEAGHLRAAPELTIEVLSPGKTNEERDRQAKLKLYSRHGVQEYWIVDWIRQQVEVYRRKRGRLALDMTLLAQDELTSPLLPGFSCQVARLFFSLTPPQKKK